jgi:alpha-L-rhamnosidase
MRKMFVLCFLVGILSASFQEESSINVTRLSCENLIDPQGIDCVMPRLGWEIQCDKKGVLQKSYRILVAGSLEKLNKNKGDLWDSGEVKSDESVFVPYAGEKLESRTTCFWKVQVTTNKGKSGWSQPASWTMGLTDSSDWQAHWTGLDKSFKGDVLENKTRLAARYFRKEFYAAQKPVKATLYMSGLGLYKLHINGQKIGDQELSPTPTDYTKVVKYNTFDVTATLNQGKNALAVTLGNGRFFQPRGEYYGLPKMIFQLEITYADGRRQTIVSDDSWKVTADGPIRANNEFDGEEYDARMELTDWDKAGFNDSLWLQAECVQAPSGKLEAQLNRNIKVMEVIRPVSIKKLNKDIYILDMGQNMVGWLSLKVKGNAGQRVKLRFAEALQDDGNLYMANLRGASVTDLYTLKGAGTESWEPVFTYHGFRYVEITGFPEEPTIDHFEGKVVYDEMETTGQFETSNATINQIYKNAYWGIRGNYRGMPTDCPQRDERQGWLGDRAAGSRGESFIFNHHELYAKWLDDIEQAQREDGCIPSVAPAYWKVYTDNMTWPGTYVIIANMLYEQFGNKEPIVKHYDSMKKWINYMRRKHLKDHILVKDRFGDWCMPPESPELIHSKDSTRITDGAVLGTTYYYHILHLLERFANIQGKTDEAEAFAKEALTVKEAYNNKFFNKETAQYSNNTVTANILSLCYGMVPEGYADKVFANIVTKTEGEFKSHVSVGLIGAQWLMRSLSDYGGADLAYTIATNRDYPSWGYMADHNATTIWELWNGNTADPSMNSHNHVMLLGDLIVWYYEYLAGIQNAPGSSGFKQIVMKPYPVAGLDYVTASYHSVRGEIKSAWKKQDAHFLWDITIPANASATVYIPASDKNQVLENGRKAISSEGVQFVKMDSAYAVFEIGSGRYHFSNEHAKIK